MKLLLTTCLIICASLSCAHANEHEILRLQKGEYYYHYLTGDFPNAMNQLKLLSSHEQVITDELKIMEATMMLSLGLQEQAHAIFTEVGQASHQVSAQSWFFLARRWFELGHYESVLASLSNIDITKLNADSRAETQFMKAASLIEVGEYKKALVDINGMERSSIWTGLVRHNLILAMFNGNISGQSLTRLIEDATFYLPDTDEGKNLRDRINLIAALHFLKIGKHRTAEKHLKRISLAGPYTPIALLQYGWAKVEQGQYEEALQPWRELQIRFNKFSPEVIESMLGVPHVLELMYASTQALNVYEETEKKLLSMKTLLVQMHSGLADNPWLEQWVLNQDDQSWGGQQNIDKMLPFNDTAEVLHQLFTDKKQVNQITEYRDLYLMTDYLAEKEKSLKLWLTLVDKRENISKSRNLLPMLERSNLQLVTIKQELKIMQDKLNQSESEFFALPNDDQAKKINLLTKTAQDIEMLTQINKASRDVRGYQQRWNRVKGILLWQMEAEKVSKQWQLKKQLVSMGQLLKATDTQLLETRLANKWEPVAWLGMKEKILKVLAHVTRLKASAEQTLSASKATLLADSSLYLESQIDRINDYLSQSRLSIARLYDEALQRQVALSEEGLQ